VWIKGKGRECREGGLGCWGGGYLYMDDGGSLRLRGWGRGRGRESRRGGMGGECEFRVFFGEGKLEWWAGIWKNRRDEG